MASGVIVNNRSAPASAGAPAGTDTWFVTMKGGAKTAPVWVRTQADFELAFGIRTGAVAPFWDSIDAFLRSGGRQACIGSYATGGTYADALALLANPKLGPGQLTPLGEAPTPTVYSDFATAATVNNRVAIMDVGNGDTVTAMTGHGDTLPTDATAENIGLFGSWVTIPGPAGVVGSAARTVPASPIIAALCAQADATGNPNRAAGGRDFFLSYVNGLVSDPIEADRQTLLTHKVNSFTNAWGVFENYSFQTGIAQDPNTPFWQLNCARARMWLKWQAQLRGEWYYMKNIDAHGHLAGALKKDLVDVLMQLYNVDGLYGNTPQEAFDVNVGTTINTQATAGTALLQAVAQARFSLYANTVEIDLVSIPVLGSVVSSG